MRDITVEPVEQWKKSQHSQKSGGGVAEIANAIAHGMGSCTLACKHNIRRYT